MCDYIHPDDLPDECACHEKPPLGLVVECLKTFNGTSSWFNDTIGLKIDLEPCNTDIGASLSIDITERNRGIDYPIERIHAGEERDYPIPGLAVIVPGLGHLGMDVAVYIAGTPSQLILKVGLNACVALASQTVCASTIPGLDAVLPWYVLQGTYSFGDICDDDDEELLLLEAELEQYIEEEETVESWDDVSASRSRKQDETAAAAAMAKDDGTVAVE